jgi:dethiobiotin synthetase
MGAGGLHWESCFVTGTDTGVGKTLIASALVRALVQNGLRVAGMKPVAAGALWRDDDWRNDDVEQLAAEGNIDVARSALCPYLLPQSLAPHIAAELAGIRLELSVILGAYQALRAQADVVIVEGVGGFRVPLGPEFDTADLARELGLPVVLVVGLRLGCLNHAALTAEAIAARGLRILGWVANTIDPQMAQADRNFATLKQLLPAPCLGRVPWLASPRSEHAAQRLDLSVISARGL